MKELTVPERLTMTINLRDLDFTDIPPTERLLIAHVLLDSVLFQSPSTGLAPTEIAEMHARLAQIDAGRVTSLPWDEARSRLWSKV